MFYGIKDLMGRVYLVNKDSVQYIQIEDGLYIVKMDGFAIKIPITEENTKSVRLISGKI